MLTSSQQQALDTSHHLSVTANAGSGKTMVLVERYINILATGKAHVSEVVAITFTEKAASELKKRISERIALSIRSAADIQTRNKLEAIREQLSAAVIDTIHSFCSKILREYPVEAGVDASFTVLEGIDQQVMLETAIKETFDFVLKQEEGEAKREQLFRLLRSLGKAKVLDIVNTLALKREQVERWVATDGLYTRPDEEVLAFWKDFLSSFVTREFEHSQLIGDMQEIIDAAGGKKSIVVNGLFKAFKREQDQRERLRLFGELLETLLTKEGKLRKDVIGNNDDEVAEQASRLRTAYKMFFPLIDFVLQTNDNLHANLLAQTRVLLDLYQIVIERYEEAKIEGAYLDFDDLQIRTKNLLRNEQVRSKLAQRFKFIMVDEYQDTNLLQYEILLPLVDDLQKGNLFIVGDPKQSIYGFRDADVTVFNRTKNDIEQRVNQAATVVMGDSFRPLTDIVAFVNTLFSPLMNSESGDHEVSYEPLVRGRQNVAGGRVEFLLRTPQGDNAGAPQLSEAEMIARRIVQLHAERHQVFGKDEQPHALLFSDIAVLLRSRTGLGALEEAFIRHNIPYLVSGGIGYFQTQGIYDFYNYFRFLLNAEDDVALAGVLRSPFFNVSDAELFEVGYERRGRSLWKQIESKQGKIRRPASIGRAVDVLRQDLDNATRHPVAELVQHLVDRTSYAGFVAGSSRSGQMFANLEKLKRLARRYEEQGFTTLYDFVGRLKRLIEQEEQEGQAAVDVLADAVKIMTIHAAKGLEFPVVVVPTLDRKFRLDAEPFLDAEAGLGFTPLNGAGSAPIAEYLKQHSRAKMIAEEKRIFYVACTRARDMLILSGALQSSGSSENWMQWTQTVLQLDQITGSKKTFDTTTQYLQAGTEGYAGKTMHHQFDLHIVRQDDLQLQTPPVTQTVVSAQASSLLIDSLETPVGSEIFSASKFRTYTDCPSKYYLRYVVGLPASTIRLFRDAIDDEGDTEIPGDLRGRAFHAVMQQIDSLGTDRKTITSALKSFIESDSYSILSEPSIELEGLTDAVLGVLHSSFWREVMRGTDARTEFTIVAPLGNNSLTGTLDRVYRDSDAIWHVLDYKTDALSSEAISSKREYYEPQIKFYALLVKKYFSAQRVRATLLFTSAVNTPVEFTYNSDDLDKLENELASVIENIRAGKFDTAGLACNDCPFLPEGCNGLLYLFHSSSMLLHSTSL